MKSNRLTWGGAALALTLLAPAVWAADHGDSPAAADDVAADISDFYAWHTEDGRLVAAMAFAGFGEAGAAATYDAEVLYGIHIDRNGDNISDHDIWFRFGQNAAGDWGVMASGLPGEDDAVVGGVEETLEGAGGAQLFAGLRDDPFFFDFQGFGDTLATGQIMFDADRDSFAGTNVTALVVEMDLDDALDGESSLSMWATASRKN